MWGDDGGQDLLRAGEKSLCRPKRSNRAVPAVVPTRAALAPPAFLFFASTALLHHLLISDCCGHWVEATRPEQEPGLDLPPFAPDLLEERAIRGGEEPPLLESTSVVGDRAEAAGVGGGRWRGRRAPRFPVGEAGVDSSWGVLAVASCSPAE
nr:unnamed protein product [Digitaria exilis]